MKQFWNRISELGISADMDIVVRKRVSLTNRLSFLIYVVSLVPTSINHEGIGTSEFLSFVLQIHLFLIPLIFNYYRKTELSKHVFVLIIFFVVAYLGARASRDASDVAVSRMYILVSVGLPFVLFDMNSRGTILSYVAVSAALFFFTPEIQAMLQADEVNITPEAKRIYQTYAAPAIMFGALVGVFYTTQITDLKLIMGLLNETRHFNRTLEQQVAERTLQLQEANSELHSTNQALSAHNFQITQSLTYAQRIQAAVSSAVQNGESLPYFAYFQPRDIVSGDFSYVRNLGRYQLYAAVDCTGHGVPGAFMSMLGISFLNEIVRREILKPAQILEELRLLVKEALHQRGNLGEQKDGMDMALCLVDTQEQRLHFAGAYNPLYLVHHGELTELKGTRNPIGIHIKEVPFQEQVLSYTPGDMCYLCTDGYADQIGGPYADKFKNQQLRQLFLKTYHLPLEQQQQAMHQALGVWRGQHAQVDDILVLGVRL